ncbi:MAG TPA: pyridoxal-dependent decarboxylase [Acidimicrobiales bacterium]|nr:pyridoxal-dependent decarboxylase [Acidimicrobiales bacterium]
MGSPMFSYDAHLTDLVFDYCRDRLALDPVSLDFGGATGTALDAALAGLLGEEGHDPEQLLELFAQSLATAVISCDSPRFLSFIPAAPTKAALLFDMIVSCSSLNGTSWLEAAGAVAAENQALHLLAGLAGFPEHAGGCFVSGGSMGNLSALVVARDARGLRGGGTRPGRVRIAVSDETHSSVGKALHIIGVEPLTVRTDDHRMTGPGLRAALAADPDPEDVVAVVATAGTTNAGIIDDLAGIAAVAAERSLWLHVDAAYGGAGLLAPSVRHRFEGIERADSFIVDPHKWLFAPFDCAALLYRDPRLAKAVHTQDASYLDVIHPPGVEVFNPSDYAFHLTRRARGLPLWFSLALHGTAAYRSAVEAVLETARRSAELITELPHLELVREPELSIVLFRRTGWGRAEYDAWSARLLADQTGFVTPTTWEGAPVGRLAFLHPDTTVDMVREILATTA